jgi:hypothetical protein
MAAHTKIDDFFGFMGLAGVGLVLTVGACNMNKLTANMTSGMLMFGSVAMDREADIEFAGEAFPASLKTVETFLVSSPNNEDLLLLLARGYNSYAFGFLEGALEHALIDGPEERIEALTARAKIHYLRGSAYGFRLLGKPELEQAAKSGDLDRLGTLLAEVKADEGPALFWAGYGWASAINLAKDDSAMVAGLSAALRIMERAYQLVPDYNGGAPILFHGVYHASTPVAFGGKPELAKRYFEEAMAKHGDKNMLVPCMYARFYAVQVQDHELWDSLMQKIAETDVSHDPDLRLMNEIARERARLWSRHVDDLILPK